MISKKEKVIVKAINKSKGSPVDIESFHRYQNVAKVKGSHVDFPKGEIHAVNDSYSDETWKFICTVEEFKRCAKEMSEAKWMQTPVEELMLNARGDSMNRFATHQIVYVNGYEDREWKFGCLTLEGDSGILLSDGGHMVMPIGAISPIPFKSKEELEIERLKDKQVLSMASKYQGYYSCEAESIEQFRKMQDNGDLAEILLPLGSK